MYGLSYCSSSRDNSGSEKCMNEQTDPSGRGGLSVTATVSGVLLFGAEILGIVAIAIMGQPGYAYIKSSGIWIS